MGTEKLDPISCAHVEAEEGYREVCSCPLCPRCGGRRVQRSLPLSPVPMLRRKKGTVKLAPVICAHAAAEEGHSEACSCHLCPRCDGRRVQEGVRRITAKVKTVICEQAPNHGSYFAYARLIARITLQNEIRSANPILDFLSSFVVSPHTFWHRPPGPHRPWNGAYYGSVRNIPWLQ